MNGNPFALAVGQTTSSREPDHSFISAKRNYTNLVFMQTHQNRHEEHRNLIKVLISLAKTWYNSWKTEEVSLPAGLIFLYSPREGKRQILAQPDNVPWPRPEREVLGKPGSAGLCLLLAAAPGAPLLGWGGLMSMAVPPPHSQPSTQLESIFCSPWLLFRLGSI